MATSHHEGTNTLASARSTLLGHEGTRRKAKENGNRFAISTWLPIFDANDNVPPQNIYYPLPFFVSLRHLRAFVVRSRLEIAAQRKMPVEGRHGYRHFGER